MGRVKGGDTKPELIVRSLVHRMGFRFSLRREDLPGKPDIVLPRHKKAIFVHGCFWHSHKRCRRATRPKQNQLFWREKLDGNADRDRKKVRQLRRMGWGVLVVWQCELRKADKLILKLNRFLNSPSGRRTCENVP